MTEDQLKISFSVDASNARKQLRKLWWRSIRLKISLFFLKKLGFIHPKKWNIFQFICAYFLILFLIVTIIRLFTNP